MKKKIIIACILLILGAGAVCLAFCAKPGAVRPDIEGITEASVGQRIRFSIDGAEYMPVNDTDGIYIQETEENAIAIRIHVPDELQGSLFLDEGEEGIIYTGAVQKSSAGMKEETTGILMDYFEWIDEISKE